MNYHYLSVLAHRLLFYFTFAAMGSLLYSLAAGTVKHLIRGVKR